MYKVTLVFLILLNLGVNAQTVETWNLQKCIDYALDHNTNIRQGKLQGTILENNLKQVKLSRIPSLNGRGNHNYNIGRTIDPFTNTFDNTTIQSNSFSLNSDVILYGGSQVNNSIKQSQVASDVNDQSIEAIRNQIALSVATTYLQIMQAEENLKVAIAQQELTKSQLKRAEILVKSGSANQQTTLSLKAQAANDKVAIVNAENNIQVSYNTLINLMQLPIDQSIKIETVALNTVPKEASESVSQLYELALNNLPEIKQAELQIKQSELGEKIASAGLQPSLSAYGSISTLYSQSGKNFINTGIYDSVPIGFTRTNQDIVLRPVERTDVTNKQFGNQLSDNLGQQVGLSLSVPIFNGFRNKTAVENAKINTEISELTLENSKNQLRNDVTTAYTSNKAAKSQYDAALSNEEAQKLNFEFSQKRFDAGVMNSVDLLTAKNQWNQSQLQLLNSKYEYIFRSMIIDFYKGNQLKL